MLRSIGHMWRIILRETPRCSFYLDGHMPEPRNVGRVTDTDSHAFFIPLRLNPVSFYTLLDRESSNYKTTRHYETKLKKAFQNNSH